MKTRLLTLITLCFCTAHVYATDYASNSNPDGAYHPDMLQMYLESERSATRYNNEPPEPHWTDVLDHENTPAQIQGLGWKFGSGFNNAGAVKPASSEGFIPISIYYRASF